MKLFVSSRYSFGTKDFWRKLFVSSRYSFGTKDFWRKKIKELNLKKINLNVPDMYYKGNKTIYSGSER
jgi:hypothetical protein